MTPDDIKRINDAIERSKRPLPEVLRYHAEGGYEYGRFDVDELVAELERLREVDSSNTELRKLLHAVDKDRDRTDAKNRDLVAEIERLRKVEEAAKAFLSALDSQKPEPPKMSIRAHLSWSDLRAALEGADR